MEAYAEDCRTPGDERTKEQRMADCLVDLILRPGINGPVQIGLTVVAGVDTLAGGDQPGEVDSHPVPAVMVRELAYAIGLLPRPELPAPEPTPSATKPETAPPAQPDDGVEAGTSDDAIAAIESKPEPEAERDTEPDTEPAVAEAGPAAAAGGRPLSMNEAAAAQIGQLLGLRSTAGTHWPTRRPSRSSRRSPASCSPSPTPPRSGTPPPAATRHAGPGNGPAPIHPPNPASAHHRPPRATAPPSHSPGSSAPATGAAASPAAAPPRSAATSTTTNRGPPDPPAPTTSAACAATTTGSATRPPAGP
jgi:hypothetical protein